LNIATDSLIFDDRFLMCLCALCGSEKCFR